jgi:hypothetical protein
MRSEGNLPVQVGTFGAKVPTANWLKTKAEGNLGNLGNLFPPLRGKISTLCMCKKSEKRFPRFPGSQRSAILVAYPWGPLGNLGFRARKVPRPVPGAVPNRWSGDGEVR